MRMKMSVGELKELVATRKLLIWGGMIVGQGVCRACERNGITVTGFVDSNPALQGMELLGYPVQSPETVLGSPSDVCVLIASGHYDLDIEKICIDAGMVRNVDYVLTRDLNDVDPSIDVAGVCNLHCMSCPRGNMEAHGMTGMMSPEFYQQVIDKLLNELPFLGSIQLYTWGEPFLNKKLAEIVSITRSAHVLSAISTNLNVPADYESVIRAKPDWIKISNSGFGAETYEVTHTGGKWDVFLKNLYRVANLRSQYHPEMQIVLNYHLYNHNTGESYRKMEELCSELNILFRPSPAYLYPLDLVKNYALGNPLPSQAEKTLTYLKMNLDEGIARARKRKHLPCPEERCLPISWDGMVRFCGVYYEPVIAENILDVSVDNILEKRFTSSFCAECKGLGLHQFTGVYLAEERIEGEDV